MSKDIVVARIIDNYTVVLNVGAKAGIKLNDNFIIYEIDPNPVIDPRTNKNLGELEIVKGRGKVIHVQDLMCTIESVDFRKKRNRPTLGMAFSETITDEQIPFKNVKIGDLVKLI